MGTTIDDMITCANYSFISKDCKPVDGVGQAFSIGQVFSITSAGSSDGGWEGRRERGPRRKKKALGKLSISVGVWFCFLCVLEGLTASHILLFFPSATFLIWNYFVALSNLQCSIAIMNECVCV